jgi:hypothetical protein
LSLSQGRASLVVIGTHRGEIMSTEEAPSVELDLREHMKRTIQTAVYPFAGLGDPQALMYVGLGLAGESGEVANQIKKVARDNGGRGVVLAPDVLRAGPGSL